MEKRQKASEVEKGKNYFIPRNEVNFEKAFPEIKEVRVEAEESGAGVSRGTAQGIYTKSYLPGEFIDCSNPLCYNGGFPIGNILRLMCTDHEKSKEETLFCRGYEGSPKGRRKYQDCMNSLRIKVSIEYK